MTPGTPHEPLLRLFRYQHLADPRLRAFSQRYAALAEAIVDTIGPSAERTLALRDLWRAKNQGVQALLDDLFPSTDPPANRPVDVQPTESTALCVAHVGSNAPWQGGLVACGRPEDDIVHVDKTIRAYHEFIARPAGIGG